MKKSIFIGLLVVLLCFSMLSGCKPDNQGNAPVSLRWYIPTYPNAETMSAMSDYIKEKLNVSVEFVDIPFSDYDQKMQVLNAGNDEYDIAFTSSWCNNYNKNISNGTIIELDDLIKEYAPKTYALMEPEIWDLARVDGKLYGIINQQIMGRGPFFIVSESTMNTLNLKDEDFKTYQDAEKYFQAVKDATGNYCYVADMWQSWISAFGFEEIIGQNIPGAIYIDKAFNDVSIVNQFETPEFQEFIRWRRSLVEKGLTAPNIPKNMSAKDAAVKAGDSPIVSYLKFETTYKPGIEVNWDLPNDKGSLKAVGFQTPYISTYSVTSTLNSISATSRNPEAAMKVLELCNTDKALFNLYSYGIEGKDYTKTGENRVEKIEDSNFNNSNNWCFANTFNAYVTGNQPDDMHEQTKKINTQAQKSVLAGFVPNIESVKTQVFNCTATVEEFLKPLDYGVVDIDETYPKFIEKLKAAGVDDVIAEINRQLDEWKK